MNKPWLVLKAELKQQDCLNNSKTLYDRNKALYDKGVISRQDFENSELSLNQAEENYNQAQNDYQIIRQGSISGGGSANTPLLLKFLEQY